MVMALVDEAFMATSSQMRTSSCHISVVAFCPWPMQAATPTGRSFSSAQKTQLGAFSARSWPLLFWADVTSPQQSIVLIIKKHVYTIKVHVYLNEQSFHKLDFLQAGQYILMNRAFINWISCKPDKNGNVHYRAGLQLPLSPGLLMSQAHIFLRTCPMHWDKAVNVFD